MGRRLDEMPGSVAKWTGSVFLRMPACAIAGKTTTTEIFHEKDSFDTARHAQGFGSDDPGAGLERSGAGAGCRGAFLASLLPAARGLEQSRAHELVEGRPLRHVDPLRGLLDDRPSCVGHGR